MLIHAEIKGSDHANVTAFDYSAILTCSSLTKSKEGENMLESAKHIMSDRNLLHVEDKSSSELNTHLGTITSKVCKYSESRIKWSFFTKSAKLRVNKLPLKQVSKM
nr:unnamed protein product [Callosobruchus analis]